MLNVKGKKLITFIILLKCNIMIQKRKYYKYKLMFICVHEKNCIVLTVSRVIHKCSLVLLEKMLTCLQYSVVFVVWFFLE